MAIQIRKKAEEKKVLEPEVLPPEGADPSAQAAVDGVKLPEMNDNFLRTSGTIMQWILEHRRMVILCVVIVVAVAFGFVGVNHFQESQATARSSVMSDVFVTYQAMTQPEADQLTKQSEEEMKSQGISGNLEDVLRPKNVVPDDNVRYAAIEDYLSKSLPGLAGESIGTSGKLMLAGVMSRRHDDATAAPVYDELAAAQNADVALFGQFGKAETLVGQKKYDEAIGVLDQIMAKNPKFSSYVTLEKARVYEIMGQTENAIAAYDAVLNQFNQPDDQKKAMARLRILTPDAASHLKPVQAQPVPQQAAQ